MNRIALTIFASLAFALAPLNAESEQTVYSDFKIKILDSGGGDYVEKVILLHQAYDGIAMVPDNYAMGRIMTSRGSPGAWNIKRSVQISSGSAYNANEGSLFSMDIDGKPWDLVTARYEGVLYLAVKVPYQASLMHTLRFEGFCSSSAPYGLKTIGYYNRQTGTVVNSEIYSTMAPFAPSMTFTVNAEKTQLRQNVEIGGKLGVGVTNPQNALDVNGTIRAKEVIVATDWADFVFDPEYRLPSLSEVEAHIAENRSLPGVPTAARVRQSGLSLAESQTLMMQKIEELTLYLLEERRLRMQSDADVVALKARLAAIESRLRDTSLKN